MSFEIRFDFPETEEVVDQIRKFPEELFGNGLESETFSKIYLFFENRLYTPSWETKQMNYSDTVSLLHFFLNLIKGLNRASNGGRQIVWFVDNPIELQFVKHGGYSDVWVHEDNKDLLKIRCPWSDFSQECLSKAESFLEKLIEINKRTREDKQVKELIREIEIAKRG